jgi:hypothetical protein
MLERERSISVTGFPAEPVFRPKNIFLIVKEPPPAFGAGCRNVLHRFYFVNAAKAAMAALSAMAAKFGLAGVPVRDARHPIREKLILTISASVLDFGSLRLGS